MSNNRRRSGFTIIEVVLVLAIAGMIFLMVFVALPALQRSQRDTQRRSDISRLMAQMTQYSTNNRGKVPSNQTELNSFVTSYLTNVPEGFKDPKTGLDYTVTYASTVPVNMGNISASAGRICSGETLTTSGASSRSFAVAIKLESAGVYCLDNSQ